jgi:hypothetical protein
MLWDCHCGATGLLGLTHRHCPGCGAAQDPTRRYYPPEGSEVAVADHPFQGADTVCPGCGTPNTARAAHCVNCGTGLQGARAVIARAAVGEGVEDSVKAARDEHAARKAAERATAMAAHASASGAAPEAQPQPDGGATGKGRTLWIVGAVLLLLGVVCGVLNMSHEESVEVTRHTWERTIALEELAPRRDSAWRDSVPAGARGVTCAQEQRDTRKEPDGETCTTKREDKGDGSFTTREVCTPTYREVPVYDEKCTFTVDRWETRDTLRAAGDLTTAPAWPDTPPATPALRAGARNETYTLHLKVGDAGTETCTVPEARWSAVGDGSRWKASVGVVTGSVDCAAMTPL